ncbi:MAG: FmdB family zinc ribbon protein [Candidatus Magnetobacterium sp. LHC-1]|uniref:Zinc ribbon domain-containing protein n=1 Tax=Candidatus Magnetobacterium casense TaxID=1455061 RepID=A0ABS6S0Q1_9BACT|nr:FmdB family zinc ribbon protein [Candidatus Magnetobacterium casensis]MBF0608720.1 zinc ribbon domain-containing protein [Nitrospirota bacterium]MBV6342386.1 zinc ribbon domain-containing protein [Candidatus Magnetobacterium casensis]
MPIYEYLCNNCNQNVELLVYGNRQVSCPHCGSSEMKKKMSMFGVSGVDRQVKSDCGGCRKTSCSTC